jgi:diguanylate cyclase (GGDEF)-like protein
VKDAKAAWSAARVVTPGLVATATGAALAALVAGADLIGVVAVASTGVVATTAAALAAARQARAARADDQRTEQRAITDPLTGLLNRGALFPEVEAAIADSRHSGTVMGVLFLDLDRFKVINDSMGHDVGDELLRIVAARLANTVSSTDVVARFGGDEFVVVCRGLLSESSVVQVAKHILGAFTHPIVLRSGPQLVSTSIGVTVAGPDDDRSPADLVRDADAAMFTAKRARSGWALFDEAERRRAVDRHNIERDLRAALADGQLIVHYQPIVEVSDQTVSGFEALVRWNHPSRGLVGPSYFLEVAEDAGLMSSIGALVMREACAQMAVWNHLSRRAHDMTISVNIAEQQLLDPTFVGQVVDVLEWSGLPPRQLNLEITEGVIASHLRDLDALRDLHHMGVSFAIDDFGTGHSSLSVLRQLDLISILKIDKAFVDGLQRGAAGTAIIDAVVSMARALGLRVVAEGVEQDWQLGLLRQLGVPYIQGYLFNRPMAADSIRPGVWIDRRVAPVGRYGLPPLEISRSLMRAPRSRSTPRPLRPRPVPDLGTS